MSSSYVKALSSLIPLLLLGCHGADLHGTTGGNGPATGGATAGTAGSITASTSSAAATSSSTSTSSTGSGLDPEAASMSQHADELLDTMLLQFLAGLRADTTNDHYWTFAQDWDAVLDGMDRHGSSRYAGTVRMFYEIQNARGWSRPYYDDENWMTLTLMRAFDHTGDMRYLTEAEALYADIMSAWDTTCCGPHPGGVWWRTQHDSKVTAINAGAVVSGARLYEHTHDPKYLAFAKKVYTYWSTYMVDPMTGHVDDNISSAGVVNTSWHFTYNEGLMIGAAVALAHAENGPVDPLAYRIFDYMSAKETATTSLGTILSDGHCGKAGGDDGEQFKGIGARYLAQLYLADTMHTDVREYLRRSADAAYGLARNPSSDLVSCDWAGPNDPTTDDVGSQSSAAMGVAVTAAVLGPPTLSDPLTVEAEEGDLHGSIGLEASHTGFSGWGYVAGFGADGEWIDLPVTVPAAGSYAVTFRFATDVNGASRELYVNGALDTANVDLPTTGGYDHYGTITKNVMLHAGENTISMIYASGSGSHGYVNLDKLDVAKAP